MSSDGSSSSGLSPLNPTVVTIGFLAAVVYVSFLGPESYFGVSDTVVGWVILGVFLVWNFSLRGSGTYDVETDPTTPAAMGEHYRPTSGEYVEGVYRVVGTGDPIALLRVGDDRGRRATTGEVITVDQSTLDDEFEGASDPDAGVSVLAGARSTLSGLYWNVRRFL